MGPFTLPKGPLFFLSSPLVADIIEQLRTEAPVLIASSVARGRSRVGGKLAKNATNPWLPYEDVWVGSALARAAVAAPTAVDIGKLGLAEGVKGAVINNVYVLRPSSLIWHESGLTSVVKPAWRLRAVHSWASTHACRHRRWKNVTLHCPTVYHSCADVAWLRCSYHPPVGCSTEEVRMLNLNH